MGKKKMFGEVELPGQDYKEVINDMFVEAREEQDARQKIHVAKKGIKYCINSAVQPAI